ncbi:Chaperone protein like [Actinidia chinensis var. chinensis]|uniref:Chaperone protein like n=1 Tax=Actinidia chinensis var. chinensis TaxID=1590841 RepID=A0A2R6P491_ACTCC|nr:Chaperone protein like [Actinidia chinensis var. chinensis]
MGRLREESDLKSQLVTEICNISRRAIACGHSTSPIVDWYLILQVEENAGLEVIRKQYHKLALQIHPDKNKHPKAEVAFKLVSEAYGCLSEAKKRAEFNFQRQNSYCSECNRIGPHAAKTKGVFPTQKLRSQKIIQGLKDLRARFAEEIRVIENCLKATSTKESPIFNPREDHPIYNPSEYLSRGYAQQRTGIYKKPVSFQYLQVENLPFSKQRKRESPVFEFRLKSSGLS